jgi:putative DNA primase/helicase
MEMEKSESKVNCLEAALDYAARGIPVFPVHTPCKTGKCSCGKPSCEHAGKHPRTPHGFKDATTDPVKIREWWTRSPDANIGIPTGEVTGLLVLDTDPRHGGNESRKRLEQQIGPLPETAKARSGSGGSHEYFRQPKGQKIKSSSRIGGFDGLDIRADGGFIIASPSLHSSGNRYEWINGLSEITSAPGGLLNLLKKAKSNNGSANKRDTSSILDGILEGARNEAIFTLACRLLRADIPQSIAEDICLKAAAKCIPPFPANETLEIVRRVYATYLSGVDNWPDPAELGNELPPVMPFNPELLPESFRPAAQDISERMQVPLDMPAVSLILTLAGAVNRRAEIQPKANDNTFAVKPNLWGGLVAPPGFLKTPTIENATKPLRKIDEDLRNRFKQEMQAYEKAKELWELQRSAYKEQVKQSFKSKKAFPQEVGPEPEKPIQIRFIINDATFESLHEIMAANPAGILLIRDELSGFMAQLERAGREGERAFHLQAWNGNTGHTIDRIGRGSIYVPACCESILGGIQPNKLRSYLVDTLKGGPSDDGFIQRFQLLAWPDFPKEWNLVDRPPDANALSHVEFVLKKLARIDPDFPAKLKFSEPAQELFNEWLAALEDKIRSDDTHPALAGHLGKFRKTMPALAVLFELSDIALEEGFDGFVASFLEDPYKFGEVSLAHARQAAAWCEYLESHARRIYSCVVTPQIHAAHVLANKIKEKKVGSSGQFSLRDVYLKGWSGLDSPELAQGAALVLQDAGWIRSLSNDSGPQGGRPASRFEINPKIKK